MTIFICIHLFSTLIWEIQIIIDILKIVKKFVFMLISFVLQQNDCVYMCQIVTVFRDTDSNKFVEARHRNDKCVSLYLLSNL